MKLPYQVEHDSRYVDLDGIESPSDANQGEKELPNVPGIFRKKECRYQAEKDSRYHDPDGLGSYSE
jgi:hypothetical protein